MKEKVSCCTADKLLMHNDQYEYWVATAKKWASTSSVTFNRACTLSSQNSMIAFPIAIHQGVHCCKHLQASEDHIV